MAEADLVHLAAHGRHHPQSPMFASVRLVDGHAYVYDLQQQGLTARHVVLSACEVGQATIRPGDEPLGLSAGLLALGVQCVVAGVSRVPDDVSAATMADYHAALAAGVPSDEAMAGAIEKGSPLGAAFQVAGAPWSG
jgi:CHAT domain-containing protein